MEEWKRGRVEEGKRGRMEEGKRGFGGCCQNARRIWASTPQIADYTDYTDFKLQNNQSFVIGGLAFFPHY